MHSVFRRLANLFGKPAAKRTLAEDPESTRRQYSVHLLGCESLDAGELLFQYPPKVEHAKKKLLFDIALADGLQGKLVVRRYTEIPLPNAYEPYSPDTEIVAKPGYFRYLTDDCASDWFLNFAHHDLFHGYGHFMFAQDEIQVAEHPALASVREMMIRRTDGLRPRTVEGGSPTPVLVSGVPRNVQIDTRSIYGARFARADDMTIRESVRKLDPPTHSNILAIEAPIPVGNKTYSRSEIELALRTAYSGFRSVVLAALADSAATESIVIHTGNWGCGAYGGNRQLMVSVQIMAARMAGVSKIVFYCGADSTADVAAFESALSSQFKFTPQSKLNRVVDHLVDAAFSWGVRDGN